MNHYETSSTVGGEHDIHLTGLPFPPGAEVEIVVSPKTVAAAAADPVATLLAALDCGHNTQPVGPLGREALYDRNGVH